MAPECVVTKGQATAKTGVRLHNAGIGTDFGYRLGDQSVLSWPECRGFCIGGFAGYHRLLWIEVSISTVNMGVLKNGGKIAYPYPYNPKSDALSS
jgi:hypothetical protein